MPQRELKARLTRLLSDDFRLDDLIHVLIFARANHGNRASVQEVGHFIAHPHDRDMGVITDTARQWAQIALFFGHRFDGNRKGHLDWHRMPENTPAFLDACFQRMNHQSLLKNAGMGRADAQKILKGLISRMERNHDGTYRRPDKLDNKRSRLLHCLCTLMISKPAFDSRKLFSDLTAVLRSHSILSKEDARRFQQLEDAVALYAVSRMHNCVLHVDGSSFILDAALEYHGSSVEVMAAAPAVNVGEPNQILFSSPMFSALVPVCRACTPRLAAHRGRWNFPIELTPQKQLDVLGDPPDHPS